MSIKPPQSLLWPPEQLPSSYRVYTFAFSPDIHVWKMLLAEGGEHGLTDLKRSARRIFNDRAVFGFNFGSLAFWNYSNEEAEAVRDRLLQSHGQMAKEALKSEDFIVELDPKSLPRVEFNKIVLDYLSLERIELIALTVAQSAAMEYYESHADKVWNQVTHLVAKLRDRGHVPYGGRRLQRIIGEVIYIRNEIVGVLHLLDKPDVCWDDKAMDALYEDFRAVFDLSERYLALQHKLTSIQDTLEILLETVRSRRSFVVEVLILLFIIVEIFLAYRQHLNEFF